MHSIINTRATQGYQQTRLEPTTESATEKLSVECLHSTELYLSESSSECTKVSNYP